MNTVWQLRPAVTDDIIGIDIYSRALHNIHCVTVHNIVIISTHFTLGRLYCTAIVSKYYRYRSSRNELGGRGHSTIPFHSIPPFHSTIPFHRSIPLNKDNPFSSLHVSLKLVSSFPLLLAFVVCCSL